MRDATLHVHASALAGALEGLRLSDGRPEPRLVVVDLDGLTAEQASEVPPSTGGVIVGTSSAPLPGYAEPLCSSLTLTLVAE
ncbi:MAG: hypothetical protein ABWX73_10970, partial [Marmoricola sp.]